MDKNAIKKYAIWARRELIERVSQRAMIYGISAEEAGDPNAVSVNGHLLSAVEKRQRQALIHNIKEKGYEQVMEEVAYTWFNRFAALRFMEVNGYLPSHIRVFTNDACEFKPQILAEAIHLELDGLDMRKVYELESANKSEELFKYLLIVQCNALNSILPGMFQRIEDYTELLLPDYLLREGSVIEQMVTTIPEEDWTDQVQIIGWLYQYYNTEPKEKVFADLKQGIKISKERIPAVTQLFTPDWIVRYMVENSLGRLWLEGHPDSGLESEWSYFVKEPLQNTSVIVEISELCRTSSSLKPEDILVIDPCQGSGHILAYMFDVLVKCYEAYGYTARDAAPIIVQKNLWGLDIDERATQLAYFSVMMKARQYDRQFFRKNIQPHVYVIEESNNVDARCIDFFVDNRTDLRTALSSIIDDMKDAKEYGSIISVNPVDFDLLFERFREIESSSEISIYRNQVLSILYPLVKVAAAMTQRYDVVVTNPPYMEISGGSKKLVDYVNQNYIGGKTDMFAVFIERAALFAKETGLVGMITQPSLTSLVSFERLRKKLFAEKTFYSVLHMGRGIFGIDFGSFSFVYRNTHIKDYCGRYFKLYERTFQFINSDDIRDIFLFAKNNENYKINFEEYDTSSGVTEESSENGNQISFVAKQDSFLLVPGIPFAYTMSPTMLEAYTMGLLGDRFVTREGMATAGNDVFLRMWFEVDINNIGFNCSDSREAYSSKRRWFPYNKGGDYRKWYGNNDYVVDWEKDGVRIRNNKDPKTGRVRSHNYNGEFAFKRGLTWSSISAGDISIRWSEPGFLFDSKGAKGFAATENELYAILGFLNSSTAMRYLKVISPTMDFKVGDIIQLPLNEAIFKNEELKYLVERNIALMKNVWDSVETSWDYAGFPMKFSGNIQEDVECYIAKRKNDFVELRKNEERINGIIASIYGLFEDTRCDVPEDKVSTGIVGKIAVVKQFLSYAVGCMFGRYSIDAQGLAFAGGDWSETKYKSFTPDTDGIIPITDDEYFGDDIISLLEDFLKVVYGTTELENNLRYISDTLGGKGHSRDVIRKYFLNSFFSDHCNMYSITGSGKRPIYWLFDSGKKNGFKCLVYMHRYQPDTIAKIRTDYIHEQQSRYRTAIADLEQRVDNSSGSERVKLSKQLTKLQDQAEEVRVYEEKIHHLADQMIEIDLDDGVKHNYALFKDVLAKIK